jgi:hypothetical protein
MTCRPRILMTNIGKILHKKNLIQNCDVFLLRSPAKLSSSRRSLQPESIEWLIEDHAFLPSPTPSLSLQYLSLPVCRRSGLLTGEGRRGGGGAKSYDGEKGLSSLNHSIHSASSPPERASASQSTYNFLQFFVGQFCCPDQDPNAMTRGWIRI